MNIKIESQSDENGKVSDNDVIVTYKDIKMDKKRTSRNQDASSPFINSRPPSSHKYGSEVRSRS